jgi:parallel beta-helix repeat protein
MQRGIYLKNTSNSVISSNMISRVISPPWHKWHNGAIAIDFGANNIVKNNEIMGEGRSAIHLFRTHNNSILDNDCSGYTCKWSNPKQSWNVCQFWDCRDSSGNTVSGNIWGPVAPESRLATVVISFRKNASPSDDNILDNDYRQYNNVPGWTEANPDGPGCVLLTKGTENNFVFESGHFPYGTDAKSQVMDLGTNNRVVGHDADHVISPGIGQRLKQIQAEIDALPEEEVEEQEEGEGIELEEWP